MTQVKSRENLSPENQRTLKTLTRSLAMSRGNFSLIFARCNYANLREQIQKLLCEQSAITIQELCLTASAKNLYAAISDAVKDDSPQALAVLGVESVVSLDDLLTAANRARDRFRQDFHFPIVLWLTDVVLSKLGRLANDFNTWAGPPIHFTVTSEDLREFLCQKIEQTLNCEPNLKLEGCEVEAVEKDLLLLGKIDRELQACWEFVRGTNQFQNKQVDAAIESYAKSLAVWQQLDRSERQGIACMKIAEAYNRKAQLHRAENQHYWQQARTYLQQALACFQYAKREQWAAQCISKLGEVLQHLEAWQELQALAASALAIHKHTGPANLIALDYAFLAQTALHRSEWQQVNELAKQGLDVLEQAGSPQHEKSLHLLLLARSQRHLDREAEALKTLQEAKEIPPEKNSPQLYIQVLEELQEIHRERHEYLQAFKFKLEQREIETKYRLRAFIGAGRLQPPDPELLNLNLENRVQVAGAVEEIVAASGRQQDVNNLIGRVGRPDCKLTVLYGQSGVGKSSIVQAGLVPVLKLTSFDGWDAVPVLLQNYTDWVQELGKKLAEALVEVKAAASPPQLETPAAMLKRLSENENCHLVTVLIFDQFEEFFFACKEPEMRRQFYLFLSQVLHISYVKVILVLREDYLYYLLQASRTVNLDIIDNDILNKNTLYYLGNLSRSDAKAVIFSLTERSQFYLQPELVDALVEELACELGEVRPIELQVVGAQLQAEKITTLERYRENRPKKALVERFLQAVVRDCGTENQDIAKLILYLLTDENNTRPPKTREILELELPTTSTLDLVLEILVKSGLVLRVPLSPADQYQLVHDYLVAFIRNWSQFNPLIVELEREREQRKITQQKLIEVQKQQLKAAWRATVTLVGLLAIVSGVAIVATLVGINTSLSSLIASSKNNESKLERLVSAIKIGKFLQKFNFGVINENKISALSELNRAAATVQEINRLEGHNGSITKVVFSDDGTTIGTASEDKTAIIWNINGKKITQLKGHQKSVTSIALSKDGKTVVTGSKDRTAKIWNFKGEKFVLIKDLTQHNGSVTSVSISPDGETIASASEDKTVKLWSRDGRLIRSLQHPERVAIVSFSPNGQMIAAAGKDEIVQLWNLDGKETGGKISNYGTLTMSFSKDGKTLIFGNKDRTQKFYQFNGRLIKNINSFCRIGGNVSSIAITTDSKQIIYVDISLGNSEKVVTLEKEFKGLCDSYDFSSFTHSDSITELNLSPNGKVLATASKDKTVKLWNLKNDSLTNYRSSDTQAHKALFSPNGQIIATNNSDDDTVKLWRRDGTFLRNIQGDPSVMSFSPDSQAIITGSRDDVIKLWTDKGKEVTWKNKIDSIASIKLSPDSQRIATVGSDNTVRLWKRDGTPIAVLHKYPLNRNLENKIPTVVFSPNSQIIATFGNDNKVKLWKTDGTLIKTLPGHARSIDYLVFSKNSRLIATIGDDNFVKLWKYDGTLIAILTGHRDRIRDVIFSPNNKMIASIDSGGVNGTNTQIRLWQTNGTPVSEPIDDYGGEEIYFSPDSNFIASTHQGGSIKLWNRDGTPISTLTGHRDRLNDLQFSRDGQTIVSASEDNTVRVWKRNPTTGKFEKSFKTLREHNAAVNSVSISPDSQIIASASDDKTVKLWDTEGKLIQPLEPSFRGTAQQVYFSKDGEIIMAYSFSDNSDYNLSNELTSRNSYIINIWKKDGKQFKHLKSIEGHKNGYLSFSLSKDSKVIPYVNKVIAYVNKEDALKLWNINSGTLLASFQGHTHWINSVAFSPDSQFIASASDDRTIKLWNKSGQLIQTFTGHNKEVNSISFNPKDPGQLASASDDKTVRLWSKTGKEIVKPLEHSEEVKSVAFSPNGETIVSASGGTINFWRKNGDKINTQLKYQNNSNKFNTLSFSSDGSMLALAGGTFINLYLPNSFWFKDTVYFFPKSLLEGVSFSRDGKVIADVKDNQGYAWNFLNLDEALEHNCKLARNYLKNNPRVEKNDKNLCDGIKVR
jgi:WD40 repeat protein/DNA replication protein DnaC